MNALMNSIAFEFCSVLVVKSTERGLAVLFQLLMLFVSVSAITKVNFCDPE